MLVVPNDNSPIEEVSNMLHELDNNIKITFFEAKTNW